MIGSSKKINYNELFSNNTNNYCIKIGKEQTPKIRWKYISTLSKNEFIIKTASEKSEKTDIVSERNNFDNNNFGDCKLKTERSNNLIVLDKYPYFTTSKEFLPKSYQKYVSLSNKTNKIFLTKKQKQKFKLWDNCQYLYSFKYFTNYNFCSYSNWKELYFKDGSIKLPIPRIISTEEICQVLDTKKESILKCFKIVDNLGLIIINKKINDKYKGLLSNIIWQLLQVPFGHHVCLQVKIFEPKTLQEKLVSIFGNANRYLIPAANQCMGKLERMKNVISSLFSGLYLICQSLKPFNPYLGETFNGELSNGARFYVEQVSHKPLIARFYGFYKTVWRITGYFDLDLKVEDFGSTMFICAHGPIYYEFPEIGEKFITTIPDILIINSTSQTTRGTLLSGNLTCIDVKNSLRAIIHFNQNKNCFHEVSGSIFKFCYPNDYKFKFEEECKFGEKLRKTENMKKLKIIEEIKGSFLNNLYFNNKIYWDIDKQIPEYLRPSKDALPSDGRYRDDLIWLFRSINETNEEKAKIYLDISQSWKEFMEDFNRNERKNRNKYNKEHGYE